VLSSINCMAQTPDWLPLNGLIAWYPFSGNANDLSGHGHNGTPNSATLTTDRFGTANSAYSFNGSAGYISVPDATELRLNNTDFTISAWIYETSYNSDNADAIISKRLSGVSGSGYILCVQGSATTGPGKINFQVSGGVDPKAISNTAITLNGWKHILIQFTNLTQTLDIYINGNLNSTTTGIPSPSSSSSTNIWIGNDIAGSPYCFHGKIDDISIYKRKLPPCEIKQLYKASAIHITQQPASQQLNVGGIDKFTVTAGDTCLSYQWQKNEGSGWSNITNGGIYSGALNDTLVVNPAAAIMIGYQYRCMISSCLFCQDTTSVAGFLATGINDEYNIDAIFQLYPNPFSDNISITLDSDELSEIIIFDITSRKIIQQSFTGNLSLNTGHLEKGIYFYELKLKNKGKFCDNKRSG
jgi:hypothetical protein